MNGSSTSWHQFTFTCDDWQTTEHTGVTRLRPLLADAETTDAITGWWFIRKGDTWRVRLRATSSTINDELIKALSGHAPVRACTSTIYEPETHAFGGTVGMSHAHDLFHADSRHLLDQLAHDEPEHRRELAVVLATRLLRAAGLDWYEQGDCWTQLALHRAITPHAGEPSPVTQAAVRQLITATKDTAASPLHTAPAWSSAFEHAGQRLAHLAADGTLTRGLRGVLTQHLMFLFNRHGIPAHDQYVLATAASHTVYGPPTTTTDTSVRSTMTETGPATVSAVTTTDADRAYQLRNDLADYIKSWGTFRTPQVENAFRTVPRHVFLPGTDLQTAYGRKPVVTRRAADGSSVSSASSPKLVATMLEQLALQPGQKVLEIGAATGINAALLAELVGPTGTVVTIELDDDLAAGAAESLQRAGYPQVEVVCGDGALGFPDRAPYDRIIITAEAWDLVPAWWDQLAVGGRIVVPLRLHGSGLTRAVGFDLHQPDLMVSTSAVVCGFVPMRGAAEHDEQHVRLAENVVLKVDAGDLPDHAGLAEALDYPVREHWTGIPVRHDEPAEHLDLWLVSTTTSRFGRLSVGPQAREARRVAPAPRWGGAALYDGGTIAYIATRDINDDALELGVIVHGPDSAEVSFHAADLLHRWDRERPAQPTITARRADGFLGSLNSEAHVVRPHTIVTVEW